MYFFWLRVKLFIKLGVGPAASYNYRDSGESVDDGDMVYIIPLDSLLKIHDAHMQMTLRNND